MTYVDALSKLQERSVDAIKVAQSAHVASLETARAMAETVVNQSSPAFTGAGVLGEMAKLTASFTLAVLEQQVFYAKSLSQLLGSVAKTETAPKLVAESAAVTPDVEPQSVSRERGPDARAREIAASVTHVGSEPTSDDRATGFASPEFVEPTVASIDAMPIATEEPVAAMPVMFASSAAEMPVELDDVTEVLSKTLPPPPTSIPKQSGLEKAKPTKIPAVSNNRMSPKKGSNKK
jgi:hypothetical protein